MKKHQPMTYYYPKMCTPYMLGKRVAECEMCA